MPEGMPGMLSGKGSVTIVVGVSGREAETYWWLAGVVKRVTVALRRSTKRRRASWRNGMVWPLAMNGNKTM
ncbi:hypothetical protein HanIR_Chr07g0329211 [Helianthus annuus]|nr:hypothetical protein HanIR_Chr07g0329211 [Helianthus annuus]